MNRIERMLTPWRRHTPQCPHRELGRAHVKCKCPIWADGTIDGRRVRRSLKTRDWSRALRKLDQLEGVEPKDNGKPLAEAIAAYHQANGDRAPATIRIDKRILEHLERIARERGITRISGITLELIDAYRSVRPIETSTWMKELHVLRHFLRFCLDREWITSNPAKRIRAPKVRPKAKEPYTPTETAQILAAFQAYERLRARAMVLLLRYTGLRVSDVATLERSRIRDGRIYLHTMKTGQAVMLPLVPELAAALDIVPVPRATIGDSKYFFWSGNGSTAAAIRDVTRTLTNVFEKSRVPGAHAHRFRHTLATEILVAGGTAEDAANILGNSPAMIRKHYAQWSVKRQERIESLLQTVFSGAVRGTFLAQTDSRFASDGFSKN